MVGYFKEFVEMVGIEGYVFFFVCVLVCLMSENILNVVFCWMGFIKDEVIVYGLWVIVLIMFNESGFWNLDVIE